MIRARRKNGEKRRRVYGRDLKTSSQKEREEVNAIEESRRLCENEKERGKRSWPLFLLCEKGVGKMSRRDGGVM